MIIIIMTIYFSKKTTKHATEIATRIKKLLTLFNMVDYYYGELFQKLFIYMEFFSKKPVNRAVR
ncbi:MAG: hypothetical protein A2161_21840 [Candidatus Schekmanbacteria bacterium RBG_13_48_7]|uniref:Uncharacterized protein n=1 Tax=Candidatus Schekmanbacteria bacterium RBG_13_48_7 TaxID=1817878 RepID=A0A1F7RYM7_9BACT|nr:MAG: hypothetical protein A2161_21840 [Candidatus Schekmanbacteria bacterium RBG_13_48_7]